jgi:hypothetical protein
VEGYQFVPSYKAKIWDGYVRLFDLHRKTLYVGLYDFLLKFAERHDYTVKTVDPIVVDNNISMAEVHEYLKSLDLYGHGKPIVIRDYQIDAIHNAINTNRAILLAPTGSGKSAILYSISRWHIEQDRKILILTPTTLLVEQLYNDFADYSSNNGWSVDDHCQKLYSGFTRDFSKHIMISTWQSIHRQPKSWFEQFDVVQVDECHLAQAKALVSILEKTVNMKYKVGTTGTLDNNKCIDKNSMVSTVNGQVAISNLKVGDVVITINNLTFDSEMNKVVRVLNNGNKKTMIRIRTKHNELVVTEDHNILTVLGWKEAKDITEKDVIIRVSSI